MDSPGLTRLYNHYIDVLLQDGLEPCSFGEWIAAGADGHAINNDSPEDGSVDAVQGL